MSTQFNSHEAASKCIQWIKDYAKESGMKRVVIGMSGGKDSYVAAALCCNAIGRNNVIGVIIPNGHQSDIADAVEACNNLGIRYITINIYDAYTGLLDSMYRAGIDITPESKINIPPRLRMTALYAIAQSEHARVCGTGNQSERLVGYCTKYGDMGCDFNPLANFTSIEVVEIGDALKLIHKLVHKTPADGLSGKSDEEALGITYMDIHNYLRNGDVYPCVATKIEERAKYSKHKTSEIPTYPNN